MNQQQQVIQEPLVVPQVQNQQNQELTQNVLPAVPVVQQVVQQAAVGPLQNQPVQNQQVNQVRGLQQTQVINHGLQLQEVQHLPHVDQHGYSTPQHYYGHQNSYQQGQSHHTDPYQDYGYNGPYQE